MLFENNNYDFDVLSLSGFDFSKIKDCDDLLVSSKEGFLKGNMFKDEYVPYKNLCPKRLNPTCEKEALLYKIMELDFAINDLNLYLDLHPNDSSVYEKFKKYVMNLEKLKSDYTKIYGPLTLNNTESENFRWINNPWPWESDGGSMYV
jgi:spore coat protein JB